MDTPRAGGGPLANPGRSRVERAFVALFVPLVALLYVVTKYPRWLVADPGVFQLAGKAPAFWYNALYTLLVCGIAGRLLWRGVNPYKSARARGPLSRYQRAKFLTIFGVQLLVFFLLPFVVGPWWAGADLLHDPVVEPAKTAHIYLYPGFTSPGMAIYLFLVIPLSVWLFGKRYCSWFCACGNLAETVGVTRWGTRWVRHRTPRGAHSERLEWVQVGCLLFALGFGALLFVDGLGLVKASGAAEAVRAMQDLVIDFLFASLVGLGAYPLLGTRVWCRYGCPLARWMNWVGRLRTRFAVVANERCRGLGLCSQACPMGIDVMGHAYDRETGKPRLGSFSLGESPCIGCGGCIDSCPVDALSFAPLRPSSR